MTVITQENALNRFDTLPDNLKEALFASENFDAVEEVAKSLGINQKKTEDLETFMGDVLMGFIYPDKVNISQEIAERLAFDQGIAEKIAASLYEKIFAPLEEDLKHVYAPPGERGGIGTAPAFTYPKETSVINGISKAAAPEITRIPVNRPMETTPSDKTIEAEKTLETESVPTPPVAEGGEKPFILHEEKPAVESVNTENARSSFRIETPVTPSPKGNEQAVKVKVEGPQSRVVHYNNLRTPLNP